MQEQRSGAGEVELGVPMAESALSLAGTNCLTLQRRRTFKPLHSPRTKEFKSLRLQRRCAYEL